jgi:hypothetical protein
MGLATRDDNKVALGHVELSSLFERERSRTTAEIVEQGVGALWQREIPGMAELEVEQQGSAKANAIEHLGEDVHLPDVNTTDGQTQYSDD